MWAEFVLSFAWSVGPGGATSSLLCWYEVVQASGGLHHVIVTTSQAAPLLPSTSTRQLLQTVDYTSTQYTVHKLGTLISYLWFNEKHFLLIPRPVIHILQVWPRDCQSCCCSLVQVLSALIFILIKIKMKNIGKTVTILNQLLLWLLFSKNKYLKKHFQCMEYGQLDLVNIKPPASPRKVSVTTYLFSICLFSSLMNTMGYLPLTAIEHFPRILLAFKGLEYCDLIYLILELIVFDW